MGAYSLEVVKIGVGVDLGGVTSGSLVGVLQQASQTVDSSSPLLLHRARWCSTGLSKSKKKKLIWHPDGRGRAVLRRMVTKSTIGNYSRPGDGMPCLITHPVNTSSPEAWL